MDTEAIIRRRPRVALVDELAHTNAPGSRHARRYQDVLEILDAGIDVISTVNIQHLESLNDMVQRMTGVRVRETLPDWVIDQADEVELIDLSPDALIRADAGGAIYPAGAGRRGAEELLPQGQPDGAARAGAAPHGRGRRRPARTVHAGARHRGAVEPERARHRLRRPPAAGQDDHPAAPGAWRRR